MVVLALEQMEIPMKLHLLGAHLMLCSPDPNRPWTGTVATRGLGTPELEDSAKNCTWNVAEKSIF